MNKLDKLIEEALQEQDRDILHKTEELGYFALGMSQFSGKLGWVTWVLMILQTAMFVAAVWCGFEFFAAVETLAALKWGLSAATLALMAIQLKLSLMPQMQADRIIRELKRIELMVARQNS